MKHRPRRSDSGFACPLCALLVAGWLSACGQQASVSQQVISEIKAMESELEAGERRRFLSHITEDFHGQSGAMTREQLRAYVVLQLGRYKNLEARLFPISVTERGTNEARAEFRALVTGGPNWIPDSGQLYQMDTWWRLEEGAWMLAAASWKPIAMGELID